MARLPEREMDWALANRVEELYVHPLFGLQVERTAANPEGCVVFMLNQWPISRQGFLDEPRTNIGAIEVYPEFDDIPEDLRSFVLLQNLSEDEAEGGDGDGDWDGDGDEGSTRCGLVNAWTWHEWNRGIEGGG